MMWRLARLHSDGALVSEATAGFEQDVSGNSVSETTLLSRLKQHACCDEELAYQLQGGNTEAFAILFKRHGHLVFSIARRILKDNAEAEDAVQQIFLDVFRSIHQYDSGKGSFKTWLLMFAYHRTFNRRRSQIASRFFETESLGQGQPQLEEKVSIQAATENSVLVSQVLKTLEPRQRRTIELIYYEGLTAEEVSAKTGESVRVVRHNLYRGLDKVRKAFRSECKTGMEKEGAK